MNGVKCHLLRCLFVRQASDWFMGRTIIRWMRRCKCLVLTSTLTLLLPAAYVVSVPVYAVYAGVVGGVGCLVLLLVLALLVVSCVLHLFIFASMALLCLCLAAFTLTVGMYVLPVVLTCYDRSRFILHMKAVESIFESLPQIVVMTVYLTEFPAGPGVVVSLVCSCVSLAFAFVKGFWIDSCQDATDFRSEVGTFRKRAASRSSSRSAPDDAYQECSDNAATAMASTSPPTLAPPPPYRAKATEMGRVRKFQGESSSAV